MKSKKLIIELRGVEFVNKGAELMLMTLIKLLREKYKENVQIVMERNKRVPIKKLKENNIYIKFFFRKFGIEWEKIGKYFSFALKPLGFIMPHKINVVMDASGFAFGDQWGANYAHQRMGKYLSQWKNNGAKVILLPQAFGPFEDAALKTEMENIIQNVDLIFAREKQSYEYLKILSSSDKIKLAPDFTNLIKGYIPNDFLRDVNRVAIIPNYKMFEKRLSEKEYLNFLVNVANYLSKRDMKPFFLIHEGSRDRDIAENANELLHNKINIVHYEDPLIVKGIIGACDFIICSRFHGVVSSLSQSIPCLATSWSHKYEMLLQEYDFSFGIVNDLKDLESVYEKIEFLINKDNRQECSNNLRRAAELQKERSIATWEYIFNFLDK